MKVIQNESKVYEVPLSIIPNGECFRNCPNGSIFLKTSETSSAGCVTVVSIDSGYVHRLTEGDTVIPAKVECHVSY